MVSYIAAVALVAFLSANVYAQQGTSVEPVNPCAFTLCPVGTICVPDEPVQCFVAPCPRPRARCIPARRNRPGFCPAIHSRSVGICISTCRNDFQCTFPRKCCSNGCGRTCTRPLNRKPGFCPRRPLRGGLFGGSVCRRRCRSDDQCRGDRKCCRSANPFCGFTCRRPEFRRRPF